MKNPKKFLLPVILSLVILLPWTVSGFQVVASTAQGSNSIGRVDVPIVAASDASLASKSLAGFICDGVDDQEEILEAIAISNGRRVELSEGTFEISSPIDKFPTLGLIFSGQGVRTILARAAPNISLIRVVSLEGTSNLIFQDFAIDGRRDEYPTRQNTQHSTKIPAIYTQGMAKSQFKRLSFYNCHMALYTNNNDWDSHIADSNYLNRVEECKFEYCTTALRARDAHVMTVARSYFWRCDLAIYPAENCNQFSIQECHVGYSGTSSMGAVYIGGGISFNILGGTYAGIVGGGPAVLLGGCREAIVSGATFYDAGTSGLVLRWCENVIVSSCNFEAAQHHGIEVRESTRIRVADCVITGNSYSTPGDFSGVHITDGSQHTSIDGCIIDGRWRNLYYPRHRYGVYEEVGCDYTKIRDTLFYANIEGDTHLAGEHSCVLD